jgi:hypothetical protein
VLYPGHIQDNRTIPIAMEPVVQPRGEDIMREANNVRQRGQALGGPDN